MSTTHITTQGDAWDAISLRYYDDEAYMDKLIESNHQYREVVIFPANVVLNIPDVEPVQTSNLPLWRRSNGS